MTKGELDIYVYAHWKGMKDPILMGILSALSAKGKKAFSFEYDKDWIKSKQLIYWTRIYNFIQVHNIQIIKKTLVFF